MDGKSYSGNTLTVNALTTNFPHHLCSIKKYSWKFHRKAPVLESLFNKGAGLKAFNFLSVYPWFLKSACLNWFKHLSTFSLSQVATCSTWNFVKVVNFPSIEGKIKNWQNFMWSKGQLKIKRMWTNVLANSSMQLLRNR